MKNHKKIYLLLSLVLLVAVFIIYFFIKNNKKQQYAVYNWNLYQNITDLEDKFLGTGDCMTNPEFLALITRAQAGEMKKIVHKDVQEFIITPNYENWSNEKFIGFNQDETAICAAGGRYPYKAFSDKLLWKGACLNQSEECL